MADTLSIPPEELARQISEAFLEDVRSVLTKEQYLQQREIYRSALLRVFNEIITEPKASATEWTPMRVALRAHAYTLGSGHADLWSDLKRIPRDYRFTDRKLCEAIEKTIGANLQTATAPRSESGTTAAANPSPNTNPSTVTTPAPTPANPEPVVTKTASAAADKAAAAKVVSAVTGTVAGSPTPTPTPPLHAEGRNAPSKTEKVAMNPPNKPNEDKMTDKLAGEASEAAWLIFTAKSVEMTQQSLAAFLQRNLADEDPSMRAKIGALMETKLGEVLTALVLSGLATAVGATGVNKVGINPAKMEKFASRLRVHAMASGGKTLLDELVEPFMGQITELIRALPDVEEQEPPRLIEPGARVGVNTVERETAKVGGSEQG